MTSHPAYQGLFDYDALKARSNGVYDANDADLRNQEGYGGYNNTMNLIANSQNKQSPWAPYFQALQDQGVSRLGMDAGRPHGLADQPGWGANGNLGGGAPIAPQELMDSTNLAGAKPVHPKSLALTGLNHALR